MTANPRKEIAVLLQIDNVAADSGKLKKAWWRRI